MALLGMGSNVESNSFFRRCFLTQEQTGGNDKDCPWPHFRDNLFTRLLGDRRLELNKDGLKQIMLMHEFIFRDQIYELHRLYQRQKDLMAELKFSKHGQLGGSTHSNITLARASTGYDWKLSVSTRENLKCMEKGLHPMHNENASTKFGKKNLDLELPGEEYIDSEQECPQKAFVLKNPLAMNRGSGILPQSYVLSSAFWGKPEIMVDLNKPIKVEDELASATPDSRISFEDMKEVGSELPSYIDENEHGKSLKDGGIDVNLICYAESFSETLIPEDEQVSFGESDRKLVPVGAHFDLNRPGNEDGSLSNDEWSCGEKFDEEKLVTSHPKSGQDDENIQDELVRVAAEAMIHISSSDYRTPPKGTSLHSSETPFNSLLWFSRIVCSTVGNSGSKVEPGSKIGNSADRAELSENGMDYFEAMTLKLEDTKMDDHSLHNNYIEGGVKTDKRYSNQPLKNPERRGRRQRTFKAKSFRRTFKAKSFISGSII